MVLIGACWTAASAWLIPVLFWHQLVYGGERQHPPDVCETEFSNNITFKLITAAFNFYFPSILLIILYSQIFRTIKQRATAALGRVTLAITDEPKHHNDLQRSASNVSSRSAPCPRSAHYTTFKNLTLVALPQSEPAKDTSTSFFSGVSVKVEYIPENSPIDHCKLAPPSRGQHHQHHIACFSSNCQPVWNPEQESQGSTTETEHWASLRRQGTGDSNRVALGIRGLFTARRTVSSGPTCGGGSGSSSSSNTTKKMGALNLAKERKAARQLGMIMGAFLVCWIPYFTLFLIIAFCNDCIPARLHITTIWLGYVNSALNPIIYPLCNIHFRRAFIRMLTCGRKQGGYRSIPRIAFLPIPH